MPQLAHSPTVPTSAAQRGRAWSVPRMRYRPATSGTAIPSGTVPPALCSSSPAKSTRKLAQQAPQRVQGLSVIGRVRAVATSVGYSGTPLWKKLGLAAGTRLCVIGAPADYDALIDGAPPPLPRAARPTAAVDIVHLFADRREVLARQLQALRTTLSPQAVVWVSWPKKASKRPTDITEDVIRELALPLGWVDVKVCAVDAVWAGLKLVVRKELR